MIKRYDHGVAHGDSQIPESFMCVRDNGAYVDYEDYAALQQKLDAISSKVLELCSEAAHVYQKYKVTQMPDRDLVDHQTIQELSDLIRSGTHDTADKAG